MIKTPLKRPLILP